MGNLNQPLNHYDAVLISARLLSLPVIVDGYEDGIFIDLIDIVSVSQISEDKVFYRIRLYNDDDYCITHKSIKHQDFIASWLDAKKKLNPQTDNLKYLKEVECQLKEIGKIIRTMRP